MKKKILTSIMIFLITTFAVHAFVFQSTEKDNFNYELSLIEEFQIDFCGNGIIEEGEECDILGYEITQCADSEEGLWNAGIVKCNQDCTLNYDYCQLTYCGDGIINQGGEECDGGDFGDVSSSCLDHGFGLNNDGRDNGVSCSATCELRFDSCAYNTCGNGYLDVHEQCDIAKWTSLPCSEYFQDDSYTGTATCFEGGNTWCLLNTNDCVQN